jgi:hypothetical protein
MAGYRYAALVALGLLDPARAVPFDDKGFIVPPVMYRVGAFGPPCTHATLSAAIAAASSSGTTVIRLANNQVYNSVNENIVDKNLTIEGGFVDCAANTPQANTRTTLTGAVGSNDSVFEIVGGVDERAVVLRDLEIVGGEADADGGGGVEIDGHALVTFDNLLIAQNRSGNGGGVHVSGAVHPVELRFVGGIESLNLDSAGLLQNEAGTHGGGLYCEQATVRVVGVLRAWLNTATGRGGGVYLDDCNLTVGELGPDEARLSFMTNEAHSGGGLWAQAGSLVTLRGVRHEFDLNRAREAGGGIGLTGALTAMYADRTSVLMNRVHNENVAGVDTNPNAFGGGVYVADDALADFDDGLAQSCPMPFIIPGEPGNEPVCVRFRGNEALTDNPSGVSVGGAIYAGNAELNVRQARLVANSSDLGTAVYAAGGSTEVLLESVIVDHNVPGAFALSFTNGAAATVAFATLSDASDEASIRVRDSGTTLGFHASVIADLNHPGVEIDSEALVQVSCIVASLAASVPTIAQPQSSDFVGLFDDDYRPSPGSRLIDRCDDTPYAPSSRDVRGVARPVDDPARANDPGVFDVGAYERQPDPVFADSFEGDP